MQVAPPTGGTSHGVPPEPGVTDAAGDNGLLIISTPASKPIKHHTYVSNCSSPSPQVTGSCVYALDYDSMQEEGSSQAIVPASKFCPVAYPKTEPCQHRTLP